VTAPEPIEAEDDGDRWAVEVEARDRQALRIARTLHDHAATSLAAMLVTCHLIEDRRPDGETRALVEQLRTALTATLDELAALARELYPIALDEVGLAATLARDASSMATRNGLRLDLDVDLDERSLPQPMELALHQIACEALDNVGQHAGASEVALSYQPDGDAVTLSIRDDGVGFDIRQLDGLARDGRLGIARIRARTALLGGTVVVRSTPDSGTTITIRIPRPRA